MTETYARTIYWPAHTPLIHSQTYERWPGGGGWSVPRAILKKTTKETTETCENDKTVETKVLDRK